MIACSSGTDRGMEAALEVLSAHVRSDDVIVSVEKGVAAIVPKVSTESECELAALRVKSILARAFSGDTLKNIKVFTVDLGLLNQLQSGSEEAWEFFRNKLASEPCMSGADLPSLFNRDEGMELLVPKLGFFSSIPEAWEQEINSVFPDGAVQLFSFQTAEEIQPASPPMVLFFDGIIDPVIANKIRHNRELDFIVMVVYNIDGLTGVSHMADMELEKEGPDRAGLMKALFLSIERSLWRERLSAMKAGMAIRAQVHKVSQPLQVILSKLEILEMRYKSDEGLAAELERLADKVMFTSDINRKIGRLARELTR